MLGLVLADFLPRSPISDVGEWRLFCHFFGDQKCNAPLLWFFSAESDALEHEYFFLNWWRFLSLFPENRHFLAPPVQTKFEWEEIWLGLKRFFLFPSQICQLSRKREAGRQFRLRPTLTSANKQTKIMGPFVCVNTRLYHDKTQCVLYIMLMNAFMISFGEIRYLLRLELQVSALFFQTSHCE